MAGPTSTKSSVAMNIFATATARNGRTSGGAIGPRSEPGSANAGVSAAITRQEAFSLSRVSVIRVAISLGTTLSVSRSSPSVSCRLTRPA